LSSNSFEKLVWRFILGIGCGGAYPLSATLTAESTSCPQDRGKLVALTFSMQGIGYLIVPLFCWALIGIFGEVSDLTWRIMLGSGSIFGMILILLRTNSRRRRRREGQDQKVWKSKGGTSTTTAATMDSVSSFSEENRNGEKKQREIASTPTHRIMMIGHDDKVEKQDTLQQQQETKPSIIEAIRTEQSLTRKLIGTAGCWFLFDVLFYGNTLFQPVVLHSVFGSQETLLDTARDSSIMAMLALPGYFISIACIGRQSPRYIQLQGFLCMALLYSIIGYNFASLSKSRTVLLVLYGSTFFFSDYGPNTTVSTTIGVITVIVSSYYLVRLSWFGLNLYLFHMLNHQMTDIHATIHDLFSSLPINFEWHICSIWKTRCYVRCLSL
jgi:Cyanate permease